MKKTMLLLLTVLLYSCGESETKEPPIRLADYQQSHSSENISETTTPEAGEATEEATTASAATVVEVSIEGTDQMTFNKKELRVPAGSTVKLTLTHTGTMPATAMGHNFVLLKKGTDVAAFAMTAINFADNEYIPEGTDKVIAKTKIIGGGESVTIEFKAPAPGTYTFICSFPGHFSMMKGSFIVE